MVTSRTVYGNLTQAIRSENSVLKISEKTIFIEGNMEVTLKETEKEEQTEGP